MSRFSRFSPKATSLRPQPVAELLGRTEAFSALRAGVEQIAALERDLAQLLPDYLATTVEPGFVKDGALTLYAAHSALAARLRHIEPRLVAELQSRGWNIRTLAVKVRPRAAPAPQRPKEARMTALGAASLRSLSDVLPPSPLKAALARMAARHAPASEGSDRKEPGKK